MHNIAIFASLAVLLKVVFLFLGWYSRDHGDNLFRKELDSLLDVLDKMSLFDVSRNALQRLVRRLYLFDEPFPTSWSPCL
jgi:hypothetical protein